MAEVSINEGNGVPEKVSESYQQLIGVNGLGSNNQPKIKTPKSKILFGCPQLPWASSVSSDDCVVLHDQKACKNLGIRNVPMLHAGQQDWVWEFHTHKHYQQLEIRRRRPFLKRPHIVSPSLSSVQETKHL